MSLHSTNMDAQLLHTTLEQVVQRIGDPAPRVFARLYAEAPEVQALFVNDASGSVRAEMFMRALECLQDAAGPGLYGAALVGAEHQTHQGYGVATVQFQRFFVLIVDEFRAALGADWTPDIDAAWGRGLRRLALSVPAVDGAGPAALALHALSGLPLIRSARPVTTEDTRALDDD